jgi:PKD repeat protein
MKRTLFLLVLPLMMAACTIEIPRADFTVSTGYAYTDEEVLFYNNSYNAESFVWDFGDGYISYNYNPAHTYQYPGVYTVTLKAISWDNRVDIMYTHITVDIPPTRLEVTVREYFDNYVVSGASVILYPSLADWEDQTNAVAEGRTDNDGVVVFTNLEPINYYIDVWEEHHDNYKLAQEDVGFIRTLRLYDHEYNTFTALVDYYPDGKKSGLVRKVGITDGRKFEEVKK